MGMNELKQQLGAPATGNGDKKEVVQAFPDMIKALTKQVQLALPKHLSADRMCRIALTAFRQNPDLANCEPRSVFAAVVVAAQMGLEININGQGYIVPYKNRKTGRYEAQFIPGWRGLVDLAQRSGRSSVWTGAVFKGDKFSYALGSEPFVKHEPGDENDADKLERVYAVGRVKGSDYPVVEVWTVAKVIKHRNKHNKVGNHHYSYDNFEMYARKVALLQVLKYMPMSIELAAALATEKEFEQGNQPFNLEEAISGDFVVMAADRGDLDAAQPSEPAETGEPDQPATNTNKTQAESAKETPRKNGASAAKPETKASDLGGAIPQHDAKSAIAAIRATKTLAELSAVYEAVVMDFDATKRALPGECETAFADWRAHLEEQQS